MAEAKSIEALVEPEEEELGNRWPKHRPLGGESRSRFRAIIHVRGVGRGQAEGPRN